MIRLEAPTKFSFRAEEWPEWITEFRRYRNASKLSQESGEVQRDTLLYVMGKDSEKVFRSLTFGRIPGPDDTEIQERDTDFETLIRKFDEYFVVKRNVIYERSKLQQRRQQQGETVEEFYRCLKELARYCSYQDEDDQIRDRLVVGLLDCRLKEKLQLLPDLTLSRALDVARQHEQIKLQMRTENGASASSHADELMRQPKPRGRGRGRGGGSRNRSGNMPQGRRSKGDTRPTDRSHAQCRRCGYSHSTEARCPALGQTCRQCHKKNHFKRMCRTDIHEIVRPTTDSEEEQAYVIDSVNREDDSTKPWTVNLTVKKTVVKFKIDTGADISVMSEQTFNQLKIRPKLFSTKTVLTSPGGKLNVCGEFYAHTSYKGRRYKFRVVVVANRVGSNLLSRSAAVKMGLIKRIEEVHRNVFGTSGLLHTDPVPIKLRTDATPYCVTTARRVPFPLQKKVKAELDRMQAAGIIQEVTDPTDWCAPMVPVVKKNGNIRICVDYKKLNMAVKRPHCLIPNLNDIAPKMAGATVFSTLDAASGFFQIPLLEESRKLTTFITPFGRFCFRRVPMGISLGPEVFQTKMREVLQGLEGCETIMDDTIVYGCDMEEHDKRLEAVLERIESSGLKLNRSKCHMRQKEVKYFGHIISAAGVRPDPEKVRVIKDMPPPTSMTELRTVCGMLNYLSKFVPHMATTIKPITDLLQKNRVWCWGPAQQQAFECVKEQISSSPALGFYSCERRTVVSADSSSYGLGATIGQWNGDHIVPIAYASRTLTEAERKYSQIEKECLALVYACEKFSKYLVGLDRFELLTDHKPLVPLIRSKDIDNTPVRCQRLLIRLLNFNIEIRHVPGKENIVADALSRSPVPHSDSERELCEEVTAYVDVVTSSWPVTSRRLQELRAATVHDADLQQVINYILNGWPSADVAEQLRPYRQLQGELSVVDGLVVYNCQIVVPASQRMEILQRLHETHQGLHKCRERAQMAVWWPGMSKQLKELVATCRECQENKPAQRHEPLKTTDLPQRPWQQLGADLCSFKGQDYLVVVDYYSRWLEVCQLRSTTSTAIVNKLRHIFASHGIPEVLVTDNGPQFFCREFRSFAKDFDFHHKTSSPGYPQANGEAESAVKIAKKLLQQTDLHLALLNYRATPHSSTGVTPAAALMGRELRTKLPTLATNLNPTRPKDDDIRRRDAAVKETSRRNYDSRKGAATLPPLQPGDSVLLHSGQSSKLWDSDGTVVAADAGNRTYLVNTPRGVFRRNRQHLQLTPKKSTVSSPLSQGDNPVGNLVTAPGAVPVDSQDIIPVPVDSQDITPVPVDSQDIVPVPAANSDTSVVVPTDHPPSRRVTRSQRGYVANKPVKYYD